MRNLRQFFLTTLVLLCCALTSWAQSFTIGNLKYTVTDATNHYVSVAKGSTAPIGDLVIEETVTNPNDDIEYTVKTISNSAFQGCKELTSVVVPNSVTKIGSAAFGGCSSLESVVLPFVGDGSVSSNYYPFGYIFGTSSYIGGTPTKQSYKYLSNNTSSTFYIPASLKSVEITGNNYIPPHAFQNCSGLTTITIGNSVRLIEGLAFEECSNLTTITIPASVTEIGNDAFKNCTGLETVNFNATNCTEMGSNSNSDYYVFKGCSSLTTLNIGDNVETIPHYAFKECSSLTTITIPESVTSIGFRAFENCTSLETVNFNAINCTSMGGGYSGSCVFKGCSSLATLNIGDNVVRIPSDAFYGCAGLTSVTIPNSVEYIGVEAFMGCSNITSLNIGSSVTSIDDYAFYYCSGITSSISIPNSVTSIGYTAFGKCSNVSEFILERETPPSFGAGVFDGSSCRIYVPNTYAAGLYSTAENMSTYKNRIIPHYLISVATNYNDCGAVSGGGLYRPNITITLTATAAEHCRFISWHDGETNPSREITVTDDETYTAIFKRILTVGNIVADNKTYNGTTIASGTFTTDKLEIDDVTVGYEATFADKNVGENKTVTFNFTISGEDVDKYLIENTTDYATANIEQRELVISKSEAAGKVYDGNTTTTVAIAASNIVSGDVVNFGTAANFADKNVGSNKDVNFDFTKSGADAANYKFASETGTAKANITARELTLSNFKADSKTYDATTNATGGQFSDDRVSGDVLEFTYNYAFADKNVNTGKDVNFSSIAISGGADKDNYTLATTSGKATADITVKTLAISNIKAENKTYDGNTATTVSYDADVFAVDIDNVTFGTAATFDNKNAGNGKTVSFNYTKSGDHANNYAFASTTGTTTANIEQLELVISKTEAAGKVYDGNTATTVTIEASNIVSGDEVIFGTAAAFDNKNVGTNKDVNFDFTKSGADAANYKFASETGTAKANITARELTLSNFTAANKVYDGTTEASGSFSDDRVSGDELEFSYDVEFANANVVENGNRVNFSNIAISGGADKNNYNLVTLSGSANANITPVTSEVVVTINIADITIVYDGQEHLFMELSSPQTITTTSSNALYSANGDFSTFEPAAGMDAYMEALQNAKGTNVGEYPLGWNNETFANISPNFTNVKFNVTDGKLIITPKTGVVVTITENSSELVYNTEEQRVEGYTIGIDDELNIYAESDFTFSGTAVAAGKTVGTYPMELSAADFSNTNANYADVEFVIVDGALTITPAPEAPNKPEATMETRYIVTQLVALPENWKWADEQQALEEGDNTATANYDGADRGNYVIESVDVIINRLPCLHDQGNDVLYKLEPTCTHKGYTGNLSCKLCGKIYQQGDSIPALGHAFDTLTIAATCTEIGYKELTCSRCNHVEYTDTVPANGHKEDEAVFENVVEATCTEAGSKDSVVYCSVCHVELSRNVIVIPASGHKADSVVFENIVEATRTAAGSYDSVVYCSVCKVELSRTTIEVPQILAETIKLASKPDKVDYKQGETLDVKGGKIAIGYSDKSTEEFEILAGWVSGFDSQKVGEQKLTVTFESVSSTLTTTFNVTVSKEDDNTNTAIDETAAEISIYAYNSTIVVEAADAVEGEIAVFDVNGRMVVKTLAAGSRTEIQMQREGVYIVRVGNLAKRVVVY